jgi:uncharacterized membrane protein
MTTDARRFVRGALALWGIALAHAALTWPAAATIALFGGGAVVAFVAEAVAINLGWLEHGVGPKLLGVPLYVLAAWTGTVYAAFRVALVATGGPTAVVVAAALATAYDVLTDHHGVDRGLWAYTGGPPGPRYRGVPWWNFAGWFAISTATAALPVPFL